MSALKHANFWRLPWIAFRFQSKSKSGLQKEDAEAIATTAECRENLYSIGDCWEVPGYTGLSFIKITYCM
jgi:hypothetical protein